LNGIFNKGAKIAFLMEIKPPNPLKGELFD
jgi:hypothetical protein